MKTASHTPGPWEKVGSSDGKLIFIGHNTNGKAHIADVDIDNNMDGFANAHLIAAAPELLEALKLALERIKSFEKGYGDIDRYQNSAHCAQLESAIKKAEGL